ncbi:cold shock domain-containing protein [Palleronia aestuarii]|nr:cold shock domain-containing protein [Palleronia aestuarii]
MNELSEGDETNASIMTGQVKWFDSVKGYGFVTSAELGRDVLLHANVLKNFGQSSISDGSTVTIRVVETQRGMQAQEILEIVPPSVETADLADQSFDPELDGGELEPARVKWFDRSKGFGFANVFGRPEDVFIHIDVLRRSSLADLQPGEAIAIRVADGDRGRLATFVSIWESAITSS